MTIFQSWRRAAAAIACIAISTSVAAAQKKTEKPVPFAVGETLTYEVSWSSVLTAGSATLRVAEKRPSNGSIAYSIVAEGRPTPLLSKLYTLYYKVDSLLDAYTLLPQRGSVYSEEGRRHRLKTTTFDAAKRQAEFTVETGTTVSKTVAIPSDAQDPLGALFALRSLRLQPGSRLTIPICDNGMTYTVLVQASGVEQIQTGTGTIAAQRVSLSAPAETGARALTLWLSTDSRRVPAKISADLAIGSFVLTLSSRP